MHGRIRGGGRVVTLGLAALGVCGVAWSDGEGDPKANDEAQPGVTLVQDPSPVVRGQATTFRVEGAPAGSHFATWRFVSARPVGTVDRAVKDSDQPTWPGILVLDGTVSVEVTLPNGEKRNPQTAARFTPRAWRIPFPKQAKEVAEAPFEMFVDVVPPEAFKKDQTGYFLADLSIRKFQVAAVKDKGPNEGIIWVPGADPVYALKADYAVNRKGLLSTRLTKRLDQPADMERVVEDTVHHEAGADRSHFADFRESYNLVLQHPEAGSPRAAGEDPGEFIEKQVGYDMDAVDRRVQAASRFGTAVMDDYAPKGEGNAFPIRAFARAGHHEVEEGPIEVEPGQSFSAKLMVCHTTLPPDMVKVSFVSVTGPRELVGLKLSADGVLSFRATAPGTYQVTVQSRDTVNGAVVVNDDKTTTVKIVVEKRKKK